MSLLKDRLKLLPDEPGVYLLKDARGRIIYVGKAASLVKRVRSYFQRSPDPKMRRLAEEIKDLEYIATQTEREALILEDTLIKKHKPPYNVRLRDDKRYPYLKLTAERYPRLVLTRRLEQDSKRGARYFGPYTSAYAIREARRTIQKLFRIRTCSLSISDRPVRSRPCLDHYIGLCDAPCVGNIDESSYKKLVEEAALFLEGRCERLLPRLRREMEEASRKMEFERAARLRDRIRALEKLFEAQRAAPKDEERDAIGLALSGESCLVQVFFIRTGKLVGREGFPLETAGSQDPVEILTAFVKQYYAGSYVPKEILLPCEIEEADSIEERLSERCGSKVRLLVPKRGAKLKLVEMAMRNAELALAEEQARLSSPAAGQLEELQKLLKLEGSPLRIEGFDVSNIRGRQPVASMVVFEGGRSRKSGYRRFKLEAEGPDDPAMLAEAVRRRLERAIRGDERFLPLPDLILLDGGKGQLSAVRRVMRELGLEIPTLALAKEHEHIFTEGRSRPLVLPRGSEALKLLQRVRDEAHRYALAYHRKLRGKRTLESLLDGIPGVGPKRKRLLIERFGSLKRLKEAKLEELLEVPGLPRTVAQRIIEESR
jgi:excinuclease ABC subunit C